MTWILENQRLKLTIEEPGHLYKGSRFDRTGNISQVVLDGEYTFCTTETRVNFDPAKQGQGLFNEFGINKPVGYNECNTGEKFLKIGVGLLTRTSAGSYDFFTSYPVQPFDISIEHLTDRIRFTTMPVLCNGYAVKLIKTIAVLDNSIQIDYLLENAGSKRIRTNEYCHNFISINQTVIDENYTLKVSGTIPEFNDMIEAVNPENAVNTKHGQLEFNFSPRNDIFFSPFAEFTRNGLWEIAHNRLRLGLQEQADFVPAMMNLWGSTHVLSPELFIDIELEPGHSQAWRRIFKFYTY